MAKQRLIHPENGQNYPKIIQSIIANQVALDFNESIKHTSYYKRQIKAALNSLIKLLIKAETEEFNKIAINKKDKDMENYTDWLQSVQYSLIKELVALGTSKFSSLLSLIRAFKQDEATLMQTAALIHKNKRDEE